MFVPIALFVAIKLITVLITKTALTKLLENTLDESLKLKNISDERLQYLTKSLLRDCSYENSFPVAFPLNREKDIISSRSYTKFFPIWARFILAGC